MDRNINEDFHQPLDGFGVKSLVKQLKNHLINSISGIKLTIGNLNKDGNKKMRNYENGRIANFISFLNNNVIQRRFLDKQNIQSSNTSETSSSGNYTQVSLHMGDPAGPWYFNMIILLPVCLLLLLALVLFVSNQITIRKYRKVLPDAEVKIQLALFKLEHKHFLKVKKNNEHRQRILEDEKLAEEIKQNLAEQNKDAKDGTKSIEESENFIYDEQIQDEYPPSRLNDQASNVDEQVFKAEAPYPEPATNQPQANNRHDIIEQPDFNIQNISKESIEKNGSKKITQVHDISNLYNIDCNEGGEAQDKAKVPFDDLKGLEVTPVEEYQQDDYINHINEYSSIGEFPEQRMAGHNDISDGSSLFKDYSQQFNLQSNFIIDENVFQDDQHHNKMMIIEKSPTDERYKSMPTEHVQPAEKSNIIKNGNSVHRQHHPGSSMGISGPLHTKMQSNTVNDNDQFDQLELNDKRESTVQKGEQDIADDHISQQLSAIFSANHHPEDSAHCKNVSSPIKRDDLNQQVDGIAANMTPSKSHEQKNNMMTYDQFKKTHTKKESSSLIVFNTFEPEAMKNNSKKRQLSQEQRILQRKLTQKQHIESEYQRRLTQSNKSLLEQWLDDYWLMNVTDDNNICRNERLIHEMIQMLLEVGDDQLRILQNRNIVSPLTGLPLSSYDTVKHNKHFKQSHIVLHQDQVNAVLMAIKPGYCNMCFQKYTKDMLFNYLNRIRQTDVVNYGFTSKPATTNNHQNFKSWTKNKDSYNSSDSIQKDEPISFKREDIHQNNKDMYGKENTHQNSLGLPNTDLEKGQIENQEIKDSELTSSMQKKLFSLISIKSIDTNQKPKNPTRVPPLLPTDKSYNIKLQDVKSLRARGNRSMRSIVSQMTIDREKDNTVFQAESSRDKNIKEPASSLCSPRGNNISNFASKLAERLKMNPAFHVSSQSKTEKEIEMKAKTALRQQVNRGKTDDYYTLFKKINDNARFQRAVIPIQKSNKKLLRNSSTIKSNYVSMYNTFDKFNKNQENVVGITNVINGSDVISPANEFDNPYQNEPIQQSKPDDSINILSVNNTFNHSKNNSMAGLVSKQSGKHEMLQTHLSQLYSINVSQKDQDDQNINQTLVKNTAIRTPINGVIQEQNTDLTEPIKNQINTKQIIKKSRNPLSLPQNNLDIPSNFSNDSHTPMGKTLNNQQPYDSSIIRDNLSSLDASFSQHNTIGGGKMVPIQQKMHSPFRNSMLHSGRMATTFNISGSKRPTFLNSKEYLGIVNGIITESSVSDKDEANGRNPKTVKRQIEQLQTLSQLDRDEIFEFIQDKVQESCGQPVQKLHSRIRSYQNGNSIQAQMNKTSQIFANLAATELGHSSSRQFNLQQANQNSQNIRQLKMAPEENSAAFLQPWVEK